MPTDYRSPRDAPALGHNFRVFGAADCSAEPLYAALADAIADDAFVVELLLRAPYPQRRPVLLFAAVHDLLLSGQDHPLAAFYRTVAGDRVRADVDAAPPVFADFCRTHEDAIATLVETRTTQTNEVGRGAVLRLALARIDRSRPIALIDVGCSAGLNLLVDRYRFVYRCGDGELALGDDDAVTIDSEIDASRAALGADPALPEVAARIGIDIAPLDVRDARDARWLRACVWPSDASRHRRLTAAIDLVRAASLDLRSGHANDVLPSVLEALDGAVRPVVFHSWVVSYFEHEARARFADAMRAMVAERDGVWVSGEATGVVPGLDADAVPDDADAALREATLWHLTTRSAGGDATARLLARSHPHARWIRWLDR